MAYRFIRSINSEFELYQEGTGFVVAPFLDRFIRRHCGEPSLVISNLAHADRILAYSRLPNVHLLIHSVVSHEMKGIYGERSGKEG